MKRAFSRKNLWEKTPAGIKAAVGMSLGFVPPAWWLGAQFRTNLQFVTAAQWWSAEQNREYQLQQLRSILTLAYEKTSYYREEFQRVGFHPGDLKAPEDLVHLPTMDKNTLRRNMDRMCTVDPQGPGIDYVSTGGSSGQPLRFYISANRSAIEYAYLVASWQRIGYDLRIPQAIFRGQIVPADRTGLRHTYDPILRRHYYSNFHMTDDNMRRYLEHVATIGPCYLHVYPSSIAALTRFVQRSHVRVPSNIQGILAGSENVWADDRRTVEHFFQVRYYSWYGHSEKLVLGAECEHSADYHIWPTYGYCELLRPDGQVVTTPGESGEIVGTGFIGRVVPFVRYRTGDFATYMGAKCEACGRNHTVLRDVRGRWPQGCLVAGDGSVISMTAFNVHDDTFENVLSYQFKQSIRGKAKLLVVPARPLSDEEKARILSRAGVRLQGQVDLTLELREKPEKTSMGKVLRVHLEGEAAELAGKQP